MLLVFCQETELYMSCTLFKREEKGKVIFRMGENESEIDLVLIKNNTSGFYKMRRHPCGVSSSFSCGRYR